MQCTMLGLTKTIFQYAVNCVHGYIDIKISVYLCESVLMLGLVLGRVTIPGDS